jgi:hypothetical protein
VDTACFVGAGAIVGVAERVVAEIVVAGGRALRLVEGAADAPVVKGTARQPRSSVGVGEPARRAVDGQPVLVRPQVTGGEAGAQPLTVTVTDDAGQVRPVVARRSDAAARRRVRTGRTERRAEHGVPRPFALMNLQPQAGRVGHADLTLDHGACSSITLLTRPRTSRWELRFPLETCGFAAPHRRLRRTCCARGTTRTPGVVESPLGPPRRCPPGPGRCATSSERTSRAGLNILK